MSARLDAAIRELADALRVEVAPTPDQPDRLLNSEQAAAQLGIGRSSLFELLVDGSLKSFSIGRRRVVPASAVAAFIAARVADP